MANNRALATAVPPFPAAPPLNLGQVRAMQTDTLGFILQAAQTYGDVVRYPIGFWDVYLLNHPEAAQQVLLDNWQNYGRDTFQFNQFSMVTGAGLLTLAGEPWLERRRLVQPAFHKQKLGGMADQIGQAIGRLIRRWEPIAQQGGLVDADAELLHLALDGVAQALFSVDLAAEAAHLSHELLALMDYVVYRSQNLLALPTAVPTPRNVRFRRRLRWFDAWLAGLIAARRREPAHSHDDLLDLLLHTHTAAGDLLTDTEIRDECLTLLIAGYETVATSMGWMLYLLAQDPPLRAKLRAEVQAATDGRVPTWAQVAALPLLNQTIQEAMRLYPPSWLITRRAVAADVVLGHALPAGALVAISPYAMHRHPTFWPNPEAFDLGRWSAEAESGRPKYAYIPFGGGPHLCIGKPLAMLEAQLTLATILLYYDFTLATPPPISPRPLVTIRPSKTIHYKLVSVLSSLS